MKLLRLHLQSFAAVGNVEVEFGSGLNVLYGPNDLGKSTIAESIRFALLLPHSSTHFEPYVAWAGGGDPTVELTFETEAQRIWRVRKQFGKTGSSVLEESRNGVDFEEVERGRKVEGKLREILRWGIPEPGGSHAPKGLPSSFLGTALLSTQADVSAILGQSLQDDSTATGKERIAAALQAVAQDPLFVELLRKTQERRSAAYTDSGAKKTAKGSVFKEAAERVTEARKEQERLQELVDESEGVEQQLRQLSGTRVSIQEKWAIAAAKVADLELLERQAAVRSEAESQVRIAEKEVQRIKDLGTEVAETKARIAELSRKETEARKAVEAARGRQAQSEAARASIEEQLRAEESDPKQATLQLRLTLAEEAVQRAQDKVDRILNAKKVFDATQAVERRLHEQKSFSADAHERLSQAEAKENAAIAARDRCSLLERALEMQGAEKHLQVATAAAGQRAGLTASIEETLGQCASLTERRKLIVVPAPEMLVPMNRLSTELATARGALDVGFVAIVTPDVPLDLTLRRDGARVESISIAQSWEIEADSELEVGIAAVATFRVRGGRREAQVKFAALEERWIREVRVHLVAAGVSDLDGLSARVREAQELDAEIRQREAELKSLKKQVASLGDTEHAVRRAKEQLEIRRAALGGAALEVLVAELSALGPDASRKLDRRRHQFSMDVQGANEHAKRAANEHAIAEERAKQLNAALTTAIAEQNIALRAFPEGIDAALATAQMDHEAAVGQKIAIETESASLAAEGKARRVRLEAARHEAHSRAEKAREEVTSTDKEREAAMTGKASQIGGLNELEKALGASDLMLAAERLRVVTEHYNAHPVADRVVTEGELNASRAVAEALKSEIEGIDKGIHRAHGALEQVGGSVARERLSDATEAFDLAERLERETEAEYEAWKLLLDQMKEADAAQASNLGLALVPAISEHFTQLTRQRYDTVKLSAQLGTEGVVFGGTVRSTEYLSVGTREQLSTIFRLSLAEYLRTTIVLDDQLVQSDASRMDWFRNLLQEKARLFQIIVFTCRPGDYLPQTALVPEGSSLQADMDGELTRAIDLGKALRRR
jgi:DNA repair exonuclease SbcCD ATPase subunit